MNVIDCFTEGRLEDALRCQRRVVDNQPNDIAARLLLSDLSLFNGELEIATKQLNSISHDDPSMRNYVLGYRDLIRAESRRIRLFQDRVPELPKDTPLHLQHRLKALHYVQHSELDAAIEAIDEADAKVPAVRGFVDGRPFEEIRDSDDLLASVLEWVREDRYGWIGFESIRTLRILDRTTIRDQYFVPAQMTLQDGSHLQGYVPALYPLSFQNPDELLRLGRETDWHSDLGGPIRGVGLRLLSFGEEELSWWDIHQIEIRAIDHVTS
jgi:type VI secretion system protein ImpE